MLRCPHCRKPIATPDPQPEARLSDALAHALLDHLLLIESEMAQIRRLLAEEIMR